MFKCLPICDTYRLDTLDWVENGESTFPRLDLKLVLYGGSILCLQESVLFTSVVIEDLES